MALLNILKHDTNYTWCLPQKLAQCMISNEKLLNIHITLGATQNPKSCEKQQKLFFYHSFHGQV